MTGPINLLEICQPFYAGTALSTGYHHMAVMPCVVSVWEDKGQVHVNILDPNFLFAYFFKDGADTMPPAMADLFMVFPTFVLNEIAAIVNTGLEQAGVAERFDFMPLPVLLPVE
jgi:hypothetical protein